MATSVGSGLDSLKVASEITKSKVSHLSHESRLLGEHYARLIARLIECYFTAERRLDQNQRVSIERKTHASNSRLTILRISFEMPT